MMLTSWLLSPERVIAFWVLVELVAVCCDVSDWWRFVGTHPQVVQVKILVLRKVVFTFHNPGQFTYF